MKDHITVSGGDLEFSVVMGWKKEIKYSPSLTYIVGWTLISHPIAVMLYL